MEKLAKEHEVDIFSAKTICLYDVPDFQKEAARFLPGDSVFSRYNQEGGSYKLRGQIPDSCSQISNVMVINTDGSVVPCCYDLYNKHILGNVFEEKLKDIWKGEKYRAFRERIKKDRKKIEICNICPEDRIDFLSEKKSI
jgi:radical SAM protein with 4Fe4S-binding SPASM domain